MTELLILSGEDLRSLMRFEDYIDAVAAAFALHADGKSFAPAPVQIPGSAEGTFHIKAASLPLGPGYVAIKVNANFPQNRVTGFPTIQGAVLLFNVTNGSPLALLDSAEITVQRTAAATALAARHLARPESTVATVCGCGKQGGLQLLALHHVLGLRRAFAWDIDPAIAQAFARQMSAELGIEVGKWPIYETRHSPVTSLSPARPRARRSSASGTCDRGRSLPRWVPTTPRKTRPT